MLSTPILMLPDDVPGHWYAVAMETVHLAPNAQVSLYPWSLRSSEWSLDIGPDRRKLSQRSHYRPSMQIVEAFRATAHDLALRFVGQPYQIFPYHVRRSREEAVRMRIVGRP